MASGPGIEFVAAPTADEFSLAERQVTELRALAAARRSRVERRKAAGTRGCPDEERALADVLAAVRAAEQLRDRLRADRARFRTR